MESAAHIAAPGILVIEVAALMSIRTLFYFSVIWTVRQVQTFKLLYSHCNLPTVRLSKGETCSHARAILCYTFARMPRTLFSLVRIYV